MESEPATGEPEEVTEEEIREIVAMFLEGYKPNRQKWTDVSLEVGHGRRTD